MTVPERIEVGGLLIALQRFGAGPEARDLAARRAAARLGYRTVGYSLYHTTRGQPRFRRTPGAGRTALSAPEISFSDSGDLRIVAACGADRCLGVGLDVLSVGRFRAACRAAGTRRRLAARVLAPSERPEAASCLDERILRLAARFSLKEAVSKALGTGLKLGLGLGAAHGVRMHDIHLRIETTGAAVRLLNRALGRLRRLGGGDVAAAWWTDDAYVYAVAVLTPLRRNLSPAPTVVGV